MLGDIILTEPWVWSDPMCGRADGLHRVLPEKAELAARTDAMEAYEAVRWPNGKIAGGKG